LALLAGTHFKCDAIEKEALNERIPAFVRINIADFVNL